jgi:hypothetical protein
MKAMTSSVLDAPVTKHYGPSMDFGHPDSKTLTRFVRGQSSRDENMGVVRHLLGGCAPCGELGRVVLRRW